MGRYGEKWGEMIKGMAIDERQLLPFSFNQNAIFLINNGVGALT
jgi:hypothetical protein